MKGMKNVKTKTMEVPTQELRSKRTCGRPSNNEPPQPNPPFMRSARKWLIALALGFLGTSSIFAWQNTIQPTADKKDAPEKKADAKAPVYDPVTQEEKDARQRQREWAKQLKREVETTGQGGVVMVLIPPGGETLPQPYLMGKYEVTQGEWEAMVGYNPSAFNKRHKAVEGHDTSRFPVDSVSWFDTVEFCNKLSEKEGLKPYYEMKVLKRYTKNKILEAEVTSLGGAGYRVPSDVEWEHACRAGSKTKYYFGDNAEDLPQYAWFAKNSEKRSHRVGELKPNAFGLHDMHGNLREWNEVTPRKGNGIPELVARNGSWGIGASFCEMSSRSRFGPAAGIFNYGVRVAQNLPDTGK